METTSPNCLYHHPHPNMSTEREIVEKFKEGVETKNMNVILPYLTEDVTYELLPSTFVVVLYGGTPWILTAMMQSRGEAY